MAYLTYSKSVIATILSKPRRLQASRLERMLSVIVLTVLISVFIHGLSAVPLSGLYGRYAAKGTK